MNEQASVRRSVQSQSPSKKTWKNMVAGFAIVSVLLTIVGVFALSTFANNSTHTMSGNEVMTLNCDGVGFRVDRTTSTDMTITCRPRADEVVPTVAPTTAPIGSCDNLSGNVVANPGFDNNKSWSFHTNGAGNFSSVAGDGECGNAGRVKINSKGSNVQLYQANIALEPNTEYVLRFVAKSTSGNDLQVNLLKHTKDYRSYGLDNFDANLTSDWQQFEERFTTTGFSRPVANGRLQFWLAPYAKAGDQYWIDQVQLVKASEVAGTTPPNPNPNPEPEPTTAPIVQPPPAGNDGEYYVAKNGNDSNPGTKQSPFRSLQHAADVAQPGDTVFVRGGTYAETVAIKTSGTASKPITFMAFPGETPVIDGQYNLPEVPRGGWGDCNTTVSPQVCFHYEPMVEIAASHIVFSGFEVRRSLGRGIWVYSKHGRINNITIVNNSLYDNRNAGIKMMQVDNVLFDSNRVWHSSNYATHDRVATDLNWTHAVNALESTNVTYTNNEIFNNYGEGIGTGRGSNNITIKNNEIYDNQALNVYIHRTQNVTVEANEVYCTGNPNFLRGGSRPAGIVVNNEHNFDHLHRVNNAKVLHNYVVGCSKGFAMWAGGGRTKIGSSNVLVEFNTFVNQDASPGRQSALVFSIVPSAIDRNVIIRNNVMYQQEGDISYIAADDQLTLRGNMWSQQPPRSSQGSGDTYGEVELVNPNARVRPGQLDVSAYQLADGTMLGN